MPIRVTTIAEASKTLIKIDGWFRAEDVDDFVPMFEQLGGDAALDLRELLSADRAAGDGARTPGPQTLPPGLPAGELPVSGFKNQPKIENFRGFPG